MHTAGLVGAPGDGHGGCLSRRGMKPWCSDPPRNPAVAALATQQSGCWILGKRLPAHIDELGAGVSSSARAKRYHVPSSTQRWLHSHVCCGLSGSGHQESLLLMEVFLFLSCAR